MDRKFRIEIKGKISNQDAQTVAKRFGMCKAQDGKYQIFKSDVSEKACDEFVSLFNAIKPAGCWIEADEIHDIEGNPFDVSDEDIEDARKNNSASPVSGGW